MPLLVSLKMLQETFVGIIELNGCDMVTVRIATDPVVRKHPVRDPNHGLVQSHRDKVFRTMGRSGESSANRLGGSDQREAFPFRR